MCSLPVTPACKPREVSELNSCLGRNAKPDLDDAKIAVKAARSGPVSGQKRPTGEAGLAFSLCVVCAVAAILPEPFEAGSATRKRKAHSPLALRVVEVASGPAINDDYVIKWAKDAHLRANTRADAGRLASRKNTADLPGIQKLTARHAPGGVIYHVLNRDVGKDDAVPLPAGIVSRFSGAWMIAKVRRTRRNTCKSGQFLPTAAWRKKEGPTTGLIHSVSSSISFECR